MFRVPDACFDTLVADDGTTTSDAHEGLTAATNASQGTRRRHVVGTTIAAVAIHGEVGTIISLVLVR